MKEDTLMDMVSCMDTDVGLVHQMPFVCDRVGFPSVVEKVCLVAESTASINLIFHCRSTSDRLMHVFTWLPTF